MLPVLTLLLVGTAGVAAQQTIESYNNQITWICPSSQTAATVLANSCRQQSASGMYQLLGVQAFTHYPDQPPSNPFTTSPNEYNLECSYGTDPNVQFTCVYTGESLDLATGQDNDCPRLNSQQPSARAFNENSNRLAKRLVIPNTPVCPVTGNNLAFYIYEPLVEIGSRDPSRTDYFVTCTYYGGQQCGYASTGALLRSLGDPDDCPTSLCDPVAPDRRKRAGIVTDPFASRQQSADRLRRAARLPVQAGR